jgi:hypothetical protein
MPAPQLEKAIGEEATSFAVHVGAKGVVNWVESEVRLASIPARHRCQHLNG